MGQIHGYAGPGSWTNTAVVDEFGRLFTTGSGITQIYGSGIAGPINVDNATLNIISIDHPHHEVHDGDHYNIRNITTLGSNAALEFGVSTPVGSKWAHMTFAIEGTSQTELRVWEGATLSGGTAITAINNNRNCGNISILTIKSNPVVSGASATSGTLLEVHSKGLAGTNPAAADSFGSITREDEMIMKSGTSYLYEIKSRDTNNIIDYSATWYEHTDKVKQW